jgi:hypothetical protein
MPHNFEGTTIWVNSLALQEDIDNASSARERLRDVFFRFRERE